MAHQLAELFLLSGYASDLTISTEYHDGDRWREAPAGKWFQTWATDTDGTLIVAAISDREVKARILQFLVACEVEIRGSLIIEIERICRWILPPRQNSAACGCRQEAL